MPPTLGHRWRPLWGFGWCFPLWGLDWCFSICCVVLTGMPDIEYDTILAGQWFWHSFHLLLGLLCGLMLCILLDEHFFGSTSALRLRFHWLWFSPNVNLNIALMFIEYCRFLSTVCSSFFYFFFNSAILSLVVLPLTLCVSLTVINLCAWYLS